MVYSKLQFVFFQVFSYFSKKIFMKKIKAYNECLTFFAFEAFGYLYKQHAGSYKSVCVLNIDPIGYGVYWDVNGFTVKILYRCGWKS